MTINVASVGTLLTNLASSRIETVREYFVRLGRTAFKRTDICRASNDARVAVAALIEV
jgi:hypothetical protein